MNQNTETDHRPWGFYTVLADEPDYKVKRIVVYPGQRLSLQKTSKKEQNTGNVVSGEGIVTLDGQTTQQKKAASQ
jgi:Mannose-6-phosphate isomerase